MTEVCHGMSPGKAGKRLSKAALMVWSLKARLLADTLMGTRIAANAQAELMGTLRWEST